MITPPEILALKKGKVSTVSLGITFASATDRDGLSVAKFDIKSDKGSTPIEIRPTLGEFLDATKTKSISQVDFDKAVDEMHGIHQRTTSTFSLSPVDTAAYKNIPSIVLQNFNFVSMALPLCSLEECFNRLTRSFCFNSLSQSSETDQHLAWKRSLYRHSTCQWA